MGKKQQKKSQEETSNNLSAENAYSLSDGEYSVYYIFSNSSKVGYLGVYKNGKFNHSLIQDIDENEFFNFCECFIRENFGVTPISNEK